MTNGHGGARPNAGRRRNQEKYAEQIASFHDLVAKDIGDRYAALQLLADGGYDEIEEIYEPAGLVMVSKEVITPDGRSVNVREPAFPHLPPEQLVCVQRKKRVAAPDFKANAYLVDRLAGKPIQANEITGEDGGALRVGIEQLAARIYGGGSNEDGE